MNTKKTHKTIVTYNPIKDTYTLIINNNSD